MVMKFKKFRKTNFFRLFSGSKNQREGMTLIEALVGMALVSIALLGLAQLFTYSVMINSRSDKISNATFLAQQQIDFIRDLTRDEISALSAADLDEEIDVNQDNTKDYRRLTIIEPEGFSWEITVYIFGPEHINTSRSDLIDDPAKYHVMTRVGTIIGR